MVQGYREIMEQSERIRQMIEANAEAMEEVTRSHKEIQDGVAGVDRTIRTILEVSRDLREMTSSLSKTFSWFDEVLKTGGLEAEPETPSLPEREVSGQEGEAPQIDGAGETAEAGERAAPVIAVSEEEESEEAVELVEALDEEEPAELEEVFLAEDVEELGVAIDVLEPKEEPDSVQTPPEEREITEEPDLVPLEEIEDLEPVDDEIEELEEVQPD